MNMKILFFCLILKVYIQGKSKEEEIKQAQSFVTLNDGKQVGFDEQQFNDKIAEEMKQLEQNRLIMRKMEKESHDMELKLLKIFKEILEEKTSVVSNIRENHVKRIFEENRVTSISKYKNLKCPLYKEEAFLKIINTPQNLKKNQVTQAQQDSLYQQLEKVSKGQENQINNTDQQKIIDELHVIYQSQSLEDLSQIDLLNLPLTKEEIIGQSLVKSIKKNQMSSISLSSTNDSNQEKDNDENSEEENQQGKMEIQYDKKIDTKEFITSDKAQIAESLVWDPTLNEDGMEKFFTSQDAFMEFAANRQLDKFEVERFLENKAHYYKSLNSSLSDLQRPKNLQVDKSKTLMMLQNKSILDLNLNEFMELSQNSIRKIYEEEQLKRKMENLDNSNKPAQNNVNDQNTQLRIENKSYEDFVTQHSNDIEQAEKEQNIQNQSKKDSGTKYIDLINKNFFPYKNQKDRQKCVQNFKHQFIKKPRIVNKNPLLVKQDIKSYCPSIMKSCCSVQDLDYFFKKASKSLEKPIDELANMKLFFKFLKTTPLQTWKQFIVKNYTKVRKCLPQNPAILIKSLQFMQKNYPKIMKTYTIILKHATENLYSFYCSTCNLYSQKDFVYDNRKYYINMNQKEILNFLKVHQKSFLVHSVYAMSYFFECFQFNLHFNEQEVMNFILPNSYLSFSTSQNNPIYAFYESDSFREYFDENYFLYNKKFILWGNLLKLVQETLNGRTYSSRLHIFKQDALIQPFSSIYTKFNLANIQLKISKGNRGNIMQFNKVSTNNPYFKKQNDIILNMIDQTVKMNFSSIASIFLILLLLIFN